MKIKVYDYAIELHRGLAEISFRHKDDPSWATDVEYSRGNTRYVLGDVYLPSTDEKTLRKIFIPIFKQPRDYQAAAYLSENGVRMNTRPIPRRQAKKNCQGNTNKWTLLRGFDDNDLHPEIRHR